MDEQMIDELTRAIDPVGYVAGGKRREIAEAQARAAHSVIAGKVAELTGLLAEAQLLFALGVGAMTDNGDKDNQERCVRDAGELNLRISKALAPYPERRSE